MSGGGVDFSSFLACPDCGGDLKPVEHLWDCQSCEYASVWVDRIPWIVPEPKAVKQSWKDRLSAYLYQLDRKAQAAELALQDRSNMKLTRERLAKQAEAWREQILFLEELLAPFTATVRGGVMTEHMVNSVVSEKQQVHTYQDNIFRDWGWQTAENKVHSELVQRVFPNGKGLKVAVLGSGGSRLAYDLHLAWQPALTIAIDFNPLLLLAAKTIIRGNELRLNEFPMSPKSMEDMCVQHRLKSQQNLDESSFEFLFADASAPPLKDKSFDVVLTPWFLDILPQDAETVVQQINRVLKPGGTWLYFGSYYFNQVNSISSYSKEELLHLGARNGFKTENSIEEEIPYMQSPHSCQKRTESVLCFASVKEKDVKVHKDQTFRPDWIVDPSLPIPPNPRYETLRVINKLHFDVLSSVNGEVSIATLGALVSAKYKLPQGEALEAVRSFFIKLQEKEIY